jgi:hypothetical protein
MNALSVKNPVGELIILGYKPIETRTWKTNFRGDILICVSQKLFTGKLFIPSGFSSHDMTNAYYHVGKAICVVSLVDIRPMVKEDEKLACCPIYDGAYSWILENIRPIKRFPVKGKLNIFQVEDKLIEYI